MTLDDAKADKWTALVLIVLGAAMFAGGFTMDRLEIRQIHPASIPGLVPMILGAAMVLCSSLLFLSAHKRASDTAIDDNAVSASDGSNKNLGFAAGYSVVYALGLVGNMPFWLATSIYITVFYIHFTWTRDAKLSSRLFQGGLGVGFGLAGAFAIATLFEQGFLVRLP